MHISAYSLKALADAFVPLMGPGRSFVGLDFDNRQAWPAYNWMGVAKSALQSVNRYLAKELGPRGIRSNLVAAGPVKTMAAKSIPGFELFEDVWDERAPLGWDVTIRAGRPRLRRPAQSDWFPEDHRRDRPRRRRLPRHRRVRREAKRQRRAGPARNGGRRARDDEG
jgi:meromycolic acid enoyl-[acyl-carrier-protein] reductase